MLADLVILALLAVLVLRRTGTRSHDARTVEQRHYQERVAPMLAKRAEQRRSAS